MPVIGLIGGIAPPSTVTYYRLLVDGHRERLPDSYPRILINSIDLSRLLALVGAGDLPALTRYLATEVARLAAGGATFAAFTSNTPHLVFDAVAAEATIPLISIVQAAADHTASLGHTRVGLIGTRFTMDAAFYREVFASRGIEVCSPHSADRDYVHGVYMGELVQGLFRPETRAGLLDVIERLRTADHVQAVILGGTELPLILGPETIPPVPLIDTTRVHVAALLARSFELTAARG